MRTASFTSPIIPRVDGTTLQDLFYFKSRGLSGRPCLIPLVGRINERDVTTSGDLQYFEGFGGYLGIKRGSFLSGGPFSPSLAVL
jgi:hypothetical protein